MHVVFVHIHIKPDCIQEFIDASIENARNSIQESGIVRFDFFQQVDDPARFILVEIYKTPADQVKHRETDHYLAWRDKVAEMMAEERVGIKYRNLYPADSAWI